MRGIFCLEGLWDEDLEEKYSVYPLLTMLEMYSKAPFMHHRVATTGELDFYLSKWKESCFKNYPILYFAFHGESGMILIGSEKYTLKKLSEKLKDSCTDAFIFLASCRTVNVEDELIRLFLQRTGAKGVFGYRNRVVWIFSAAVEILLLSEIQNAEISSQGLSTLRRRVDHICKNFNRTDVLFATEKRIQIVGKSTSEFPMHVKKKSFKRKRSGM
ncbi:hypothetical protein CHISP_0141 [Chitinispirillum alkaliphilum]|nr:hypothetical protein CHISP_0141 [Chitinispirillum alkaliphilum]